MPDVVIDIDGITYVTDFTGFGAPMMARAASEKQVRLEPWTLQAHLLALAECVVPTQQGLGLDAWKFSREILEHSRVDASLHEDFAPLSLWWASGGQTVRAEALGGGWYKCGAMLARLRPWTSGERFIALSRCQLASEGGISFNLSAYLEAMLEASVAELPPPRLLAELNPSEMHALLDAVIALNIPDHSTTAIPESPEANRLVLRLCQILGWTPSQVLAAPAAEMDRLLALIGRVESDKPRPPSRQQGLSSYPDAVIIRIEDE